MFQDMTFSSCVAVTYTIETKYGYVILGNALTLKNARGCYFFFTLNLTIKVLWMALLYGIELVMILKIQCTSDDRASL